MSQRTAVRQRRPPGMDAVTIDVVAVAGQQVSETGRMSEGQRREIEGRVPRGRLGPVEQAGDRDAVDGYMLDVQVTVDEYRSPG